jgi:putative tryptophan/tyrosine transport system substrate-binding protein
MRRREFIGVLGGAAVWPVVARAQPPNTETIGVLIAGNPEPFWTLFREGMRDLGYADSKIRYELRSRKESPICFPPLPLSSFRARRTLSLHT